MFGFFKRQPKAPEAAAVSADQESGLTMRDIVSDPKKLASWVEEFMILAPPWETNFQLLPDEASQRALLISFAQKERLAKEFHVLRISGVLACIRNLYDDANYEALLNDLAGRLARALDLDRLTLGQALMDYVHLFMAKENEELEQSYMLRMFEDNPNFLRIKVAGVGTVACEQVAAAHDIFRRAITGAL